MEDIREIKELEQIANIRISQGIEEDDQYLLEDDRFLLDVELEERGRQRVLNDKGSYFIGDMSQGNNSKDQEFDDESLEYDEKKKVYRGFVADDDFVSVDKTIN